MANYWVVEADNGGWDVKAEGAQRASSHYLEKVLAPTVPLAATAIGFYFGSDRTL